jgi:hypothetical protein
MLSRETGRLADIEELLERTVSEFPTRPVFRCALACLHADLRHSDQARRLLQDLAVDDFGVIQQDNEYLFSLALLADTAHGLGEIGAAAVLYDLLAPRAHLNASNADELATGSVSRPLGVLAAVMSRWEQAASHFDAALTQNGAMGARPWVGHSRHDYGRMLLARDGVGDRDRARAMLISARDEYAALGMTTWAEQAQALLDPL